MILSVDQGEELFLAEAREEAEPFLGLLRHMLREEEPTVIAVFTIRSDNYERLQLTKELADVRQEMLSLPPVPKGSYAEVIKGPARRLDGTARALKIDEKVLGPEHPDVAIGGSGIENPDGSDWPIAFRFPTILSEVSWGLELGLVAPLLRRWEVAKQMSKIPQPVDWICGAAMMIRPAVLAAIGGLDENYFLYFEETDLCFRARQAGFSTWYVPESRIMHIVGQSTKVNERTGRPKRLPAYWFESRRRYFAVNFGIGRAMAIDIAALWAHSIGWLKRIVLRRNHTIVPHLIRDLFRHSVLWKSNRRFPPFRGFQPRL